MQAPLLSCVLLHAFVHWFIHSFPSCVPHAYSPPPSIANYSNAFHIRAFVVSVLKNAYCFACMCFHLHKWCRVIAVTLFHSVVIHHYVLMSCPCCCVIIWSVCVSTTSCLSLIWWWTHRHWFLPPDTSNNVEWNSCTCPHMVYVRISLGFRRGSRISWSRSVPVVNGTKYYPVNLQRVCTTHLSPAVPGILVWPFDVLIDSTLTIKTFHVHIHYL